MIGSAKPASGFYKLVPFGVAVVVLFLSFLPVGIDDSMLTLGPQLLLCVVFYWAVRAPHMMPPASVFVLGIAIDLFSAGPLGFWALIYLFGVLIARQLPVGLMYTRLGRLSGLLLVVFVLAAAQVGVASLYQLKWIDWHPVLAGTLVAGGITLLIDLVWRDRAAERPVNVTVRGDGAAHV